MKNSIAILRKFHGTPEAVAQLEKIRAGALQAAERLEAEGRDRAACLDDLPEPARSVECLYWVERRPFKEIAERLNYSLSYVHQVHSKTIRDMNSGKAFLSEQDG